MILVTGGAGYIGSHTCIELLTAGFDVIVLDNFSNSKPEAIKRVEDICGKTVSLIEGDVRNSELLNEIFSNHKIDAVIHFAGLKAVGESVEKPLMYYNNNLVSTIALCEAMEAATINDNAKSGHSKNLVFSSSATVYGDPEVLPLTEDMPLSATNPYGRSKLIIEEMLRDLPAADAMTDGNDWQVALCQPSGCP